MKRFIVVLVCASSVAVSGCNLPEGTLGNALAKIDPGVNGKKRALLAEDANRIATLNAPVERHSIYDRIFGGTDGTAVLKYLDERVNYLIPEGGKIDARLAPLGEMLSLESAANKLHELIRKPRLVLGRGPFRGRELARTRNRVWLEICSRWSFKRSL